MITLKLGAGSTPMESVTVFTPFLAKSSHTEVCMRVPIPGGNDVVLYFRHQNKFPAWDRWELFMKSYTFVRYLTPEESITISGVKQE